MDYLYLLIALFSMGAQSVACAFYQRKTKNASPLFFTLTVSFFMGVFFFAANGFSFKWNDKVALYGSVFGVCSFLYNFCLNKAFSTGKISLTTLLLSYSLILPTLFGIFFYRDTLSVLFYIGSAVLIVSLFLISPVASKKTSAVKGVNADGDCCPAVCSDKCDAENFRKNENSLSREEKNEKFSPLWLLFVAICFFANGFCSILQTYSQKQTGGAFACEFMITASVVIFILSGAGFLFSHRKVPEKQDFSVAVLSAAACGILQGACNLFVMFLTAGSMSVSLIFPVISAGSVIITYFASRFIFREKLTATQNVGFILGIIAVILYNI